MFRRRRTDEPVPAEVAFFSAKEWNRFVEVVEKGLTKHGLTFGRDGTSVVVSGPDTQTLGLTNLAQVCHGEPPGRWPGLVDEFLGALGAAAEAEELRASFDSARSYLKLRLYPDDYAAGVDVELVARPFAESVIAVAALDLPTSVQTITTDDVARWGVPVDEVLAVALANTRGEGPTDRDSAEVADGVVIDVLFGDSFFTTTAVAWLGELVEIGERGALVAIPHRHMILVHPIHGAGAVQAVGHVIAMARRFYVEGPGSLSQHLYWWRDGELVWQPASVDDDGRIEFHPTDEFMQALDSLD